MKKAYSFRLSEDAVMTIRIRAKERHCSEAAAVESFVLGSSGVTGNTVACDASVAGSIPALPTISGIAPKGSFTKEELKALIAGKPSERSGSLQPEEKSILDTPRAGFDYEENCEKYRVREEKSGIAIYWVGEDEERRVRSLRPGELEQLWTKRIIK